MVTMAILMVVLAGVLTSHLFGLRMFEITKAKLGASDQARVAIQRLIGEIRSAKTVRIGNGNLVFRKSRMGVCSKEQPSRFAPRRTQTISSGIFSTPMNGA